jgi:hypothetical protein
MAKLTAYQVQEMAKTRTTTSITIKAFWAIPATNLLVTNDPDVRRQVYKVRKLNCLSQLSVDNGASCIVDIVTPDARTTIGVTGVISRQRS